MAPLTTVTTAWTIAKPVSKKIYDLGRCIEDREAKQEVNEIPDKVRKLKQSASILEDKNRDLRETLCF
jgi:hypothetical protein